MDFLDTVASSSDDWSIDWVLQKTQDGSGVHGPTNNLQRCFLCPEPLYFDSLSLLRHNLTHLQVSLERLPDEIFQIHETEMKLEVIDAPGIVEINQYINTEHSEIKSEIDDIQSENKTEHVFGEETLNKHDEHSIIIDFTKNKQCQTIDCVIIKSEMEEITSENNINQVLDVERLNKAKEYNNNEDPVTESKLQNFFNSLIKFETEDMDNSNKDIKSNSNVESRLANNELPPCDNNIKCEIEELNLECYSDAIINVENSNIDNENNSNIETETKRRLQHFDGTIIKCEIEEIHSDNSVDFVADIENTDKHRESNNDIDLGNIKQECNVHISVIKTEIGEMNSDDSMKLLDTKKSKKVSKRNDKAKKKPQQCHICKKFVCHKQLGQHVSEVHTNKKINCEYCNSVFKCRKTMRSHMNNVHRVLKFQCDNCQRTFNSKDCLQKHMKNAHGKAVICNICGSRLASEMYLAPHMRRVHYDDGKVHSCEICEKIFKSPRYLRIHMKNSHSVSSKRKVSTRTRKK